LTAAGEVGIGTLLNSTHLPGANAFAKLNRPAILVCSYIEAIQGLILGSRWKPTGLQIVKFRLGYGPDGSDRSNKNPYNRTVL
jgi:hypothetical protein